MGVGLLPCAIVEAELYNSPAGIRSNRAKVVASRWLFLGNSRVSPVGYARYMNRCVGETGFSTFPAYPMVDGVGTPVAKGQYSEFVPLDEFPVPK